MPPAIVKAEDGVGFIEGGQSWETLFEAGPRRLLRIPAAEGHPPLILKILAPGAVTAQARQRATRQKVLLDSLAARDMPRILGIEEGSQGLLIAFADPGGLPLESLPPDLPWPLILDLAQGLVRRIDALHDQGILLRSVGRASFLASPDGALVSLLDLDDASPLGGEASRWLDPELLAESLASFSPERTGRINRPLDHRSDYYSLGTVLYRLICGSPPFVSADALGIIHGHLALRPQPPREARPDTPLALSGIVMKLLEKTAEGRYQSAGGILSDLEACARSLGGEGGQEAFSLGRADGGRSFSLPQGLFGREAEVAALQASWAKVEAGGGGLVLVSGPAGVGKTALIRELEKPVAEARGYFAEGAFDEFGEAKPYSAWIEILKDLSGLLRLENELVVAGLREEVQAEGGSEARLLASFVPSLSLVLGEGSEALALEDGSAQNRIHGAFHSLLKALTGMDGEAPSQGREPRRGRKARRSLVLFLDDLQWMDPESQDLLLSLLEAEDLGACLFVCSHRLGWEGPAALTAAAARGGKGLLTLALAALEQRDVEAFIEAALRLPPGEAQGLAEILEKRTGGNAFYFRRALAHLVEKGSITWDGKAKRWTWDRSRLESLPPAAGVIDLLAGNMRDLEAPVLDVLRFGACLSGQFDLDTLGIISGRRPEVLGPAADRAVDLGYIVAKGPDRYGFVHDRIRQAAYALLPENERPGVHRKIALALMGDRPGRSESDRLYDISGQLGRSGPPPDRAGALEAAGIHLAAGRRALGQGAFRAALSYLDAGLATLPDTVAGRDRGEDGAAGLALALEVAVAEATCLSGNYGRLAEAAAWVHGRRPGILEEARVYESEIKALTAQGELSKALALGLRVLSLLGLDLPLEPTKEEAEAAIEATRAELARLGLPAIPGLGPCKEARQKAIMGILGTIGEPAYVAAPGLLVVWASTIAFQSLRHGAAPVTPFAYAAFGLVLCASGTWIEEGYALGRLAVELAARPEGRPVRCRVLNIFGCMISPTVRPLAESLEILGEGGRMARLTGDYTSGAFALFNQGIYAFYSGEALPRLAARLTHNRGLVQALGQPLVAGWIQVQERLVAALRGLGPGDLDTQAWEAKAQAGKDMTGLAYFHLWELLLARFRGDGEAMDLEAARTRDYLAAIQGTFGRPVFSLHEALALLDRGLEGTDPRIEEDLGSLQGLARLAPGNFAHKASLVKAGLFRSQGAGALAIKAWEEAAREAKEGGFLAEAVLALGLEADYLGREGLSELAATVRERARGLARTWGLGLGPLAGSAPEGQGGTAEDSGEAGNAGLDALSLLKASQSISREIEYTSLVASLMDLAVENAGASRAVLVLEREDGPWIEAMSGSPAQARPVLASGLVPETVLAAARRGRETFLVDDALEDGALALDPYITSHRIHSILCVPILARAETLGLIYLENDLAPGSFTPARARVIEALASQAAISIENARVVERLRDSEQRLKLSEERYRTLFEEAPDAILVYDHSLGRFVDANPTALALFECGRERLLASGPGDFYASDQPDGLGIAESIAVNDARARAGEEVTVERHLLFHREDGSVKTKVCEVRLARIPLSDRPLARASYIDVTQRKEAEASLKTALADKEALIRELYHRTKNNMQVISALLANHAESSEGRKPSEVFQDMEGRIYSMSLVHEMLYSSRDLSRIDFAAYLERLCGLVLSGYVPREGGKEGGIELRVEAEPLPLLFDLAVPCGLIANELVTNALKYAFGPKGRGRILVGLGLSPEGYIELRVEDDGRGLPAGFDPETDGHTGLQTVFAIGVHQLKGRVRIGPREGGGTSCLVRFPNEGYSPRV